MTDIFDATILCKHCDQKMEPVLVNKESFQLRAVKCPGCGDKIVHPSDLNNLERFNCLKGKTYNVKLRVVGNSHAVSIPKEIVSFIHQHERMVDDMVRLCFEDMRKISLVFGDEIEKIGKENMEEIR
jgi:hypothetical protein